VAVSLGEAVSDGVAVSDAVSEGVSLAVPEGVCVGDWASDEVEGASAVTAFPDSRRAGSSLSALISFQIWSASGVQNTLPQNSDSRG
jgi:hypothetical protein